MISLIFVYAGIQFCISLWLVLVFHTLLLIFESSSFRIRVICKISLNSGPNLEGHSRVLSPPICRCSAVLVVVQILLSIDDLLWRKLISSSISFYWDFIINLPTTFWILGFNEGFGNWKALPLNILDTLFLSNCYWPFNSSRPRLDISMVSFIRWHVGILNHATTTCILMNNFDRNIQYMMFVWHHHKH